MRKSIKLAVLATVAVFAMAFAAGTASAISVSPAGRISSTSLGVVTFRGSGFSVECRVTLDGSLAASVTNAARSHVGSITAAAANECRGGGARPLVTGGAWTITTVEAARLSGETGTINLLFSNVQFLIEVFGVSCLYTGTATAELRASGNPLTTRLVRINGTNVRRTSGSFLCPATGTLEGEFRLPTQTLTLP